MDPKLLADMRDHLTMTSNADGAVTIRYDLSIYKHPSFKELTSGKGQEMRGISGYKLALLNQSVIIRYDASIIAPALWDALFSASQGPELDAAVQALRDVTAL
ncbi:MAG: hypothetical protein R3Y11_07745 [Pseudomonadota bacterium]